MSRITLMDICDGIAATFNGMLVTLNAGTAPVAVIAHSYDEITEGQQDTPTLQIIPTLSGVDAEAPGPSDRSTFGACLRQGEYAFSVEAYPRQRSHAGEDYEAMVRLWDAVEAVLEEQGKDCNPRTGVCTAFGIPGIKSFGWSAAAPEPFNYGGADYLGFTLTITVRVF
jgi:hypothetical protein